MGLSIFKIESVFDKGGNKRNPNINTLNKTRNDDIQDTNGTVCYTSIMFEIVPQCL